MHRNFLKIVFSTGIIICCLNSCKNNPSVKKDEVSTTPPTQLLKWTSWDTTTDEEQIPTIFTYDEQGHIKTLSRGNFNYTATYSNGKLTKLKSARPAGGEVSYTMEYNANGQMTKVVFVDMNPNDQGFIKTFTYNLNGKVSRTVNLNTNEGTYNPRTEDFEWNGDNIIKKTSSSIMVPAPNITEYLSYDNKLNPFNLGDVFPIIINGTPISKNNYINYRQTSTLTNNYERMLTYNANGYLNSVYDKQAPKVGTKFYYNR